MKENLNQHIFYGWVIIAALFVINFATQATGMLNLGLFIIPMSEDMGISRSLFGWLITSRSLAGGISGYFLGRVLDRFGPRIPITCSALITVFCMMGIGLTDHVYKLFLLFTIVGLAGLTTPAGGLYAAVPAAKWFVRRRGIAMGLASLGMGIGAIIFLPVTQFCIDGFGWRMTWIYLGIACLILILPSALIFLRRQPEDMGLRPDGDSPMESMAGSSSYLATDETVWTVSDAARTKSFWLLNAVWVISGFWGGASQHRIPYWMGLGFDAQTVSYAFAVDAAAAALTMMIAGFLLDRFPARYVAACSFVGFIGALGLMLIASNTYHLFFSSILFGLSVGISVVCQTYFWANYYGRTFLGTIRGITLPAMLIANAVGAPTFGYIYDITGSYGSAWKLLMVLYGIAILCMLSAKPPSK